LIDARSSLGVLRFSCQSDDLCRSLICLPGSQEQCVFQWQGRFTMSASDVGLVSSCDVSTWWEQKLSALKIVVLSVRCGSRSSVSGEEALLLDDTGKVRNLLTCCAGMG
ncbi:hypothetical protein TNCV_4571761, partial [Trichonephila clavipes]